MSLRKAPSRKKRFFYLGCCFTVLFALLILRLFQIQIIDGKKYAKMALPQQTVTVDVEEKRGDITDRNGIPFTQADEVQELLIFPRSIGFDDSAYEAIEKLTGKPKAYFNHKDQTYYQEIITDPDSARIRPIQKGQYPGVLYQERSLRYGDHSLARHVIGYLRKSDGVPMSGMEKVYESYLHPGSVKQVQAVADAKDHIIPGLGYQITDPMESCQVRLTLDYDIQQILENVLDQYPDRHHSGLVVDARTGDILALASRPQFKQYDPECVMNHNEEPSFLAMPFEQYPLGSVFKVVVAAAALESDKYTENTRFTCTGGIQVGSRFFSCHTSSGGLGGISLREALAYSCNDTFIRIAMDLGGEDIVKMAEKFGLGKALDIELPNAAGLLMSRQEYTGPGIANLAIGQGETMVTPLQIADLMTTLANGGQRKQLRLVAGLTAPDGSSLKNVQKTAKSSRKDRTMGRVISEKTAGTLSEWMGDVTEYGTAEKARDPQIGGIAGKTGTPQVSGDPYSKEYGWFAGYFPKKDPRYVIVVLSKEEGGADQVAVPLFHDIAKNIRIHAGQ
ncbi:penicillin-binding protein 2 [Eubacteriales bacterium mix99]